MEIHVTEPKRDLGFYWVERNGDLFIAEYRAYTNEVIEEDYYEEHPDMELGCGVCDFGWLIDFGDEEARIYGDKYFQWIGPIVPKPVHPENGEASSSRDANATGSAKADDSPVEAK